MQKNRLAQHWIPFKKNRAECRLCPRHCRPKNDRMGFCGVRGTIDGEFRSFNFGQSLAATEEIIETEAINHFAPGARILSMGNVGCMMACSFCQNWKTSQIQHLDYQSVRHYTPEQLIELCLENDIPIISWTYNDPVVWHEFVVETSGLAHKNGIKTLYKSAFYIEEEPVKELIECIDIFSLSLKSLDEKFYQKETKATLKPVLERIKQVAISDRHLEISQLVIPELNDGDKDINQTIDWLIDNVGNHVPLHFVAFHPAYNTLT
jgi:pyruvate formate lyase activating enzyme